MIKRRPNKCTFMVSYLKGLRAKFRYFMGMVNGTNMNQKIVQRFFQRLFCRFRKLVLVNNKNKLVAKMDNYISYYYVPTMYIFMIYVLIFIAGVLLLCISLKLSSEIYTCLGSNNKKCRNMITKLWPADAISNAGRCRENAYIFH